MSIHASRFSSRSPNHREPRRYQPKFLVKLVKLLLVIVIALGVLQGVRLALLLISPLPNIPNEPTYPISMKTYNRTNLLLVSFNSSVLTYLAVLSVNSNENPKLLPLDPATLVNLPGRRGEYRLREIPAQAHLDNLGSINLLRDTVSRTLAIPIDGYLEVGASDWPAISREFGAGPNDILNDLGSIKFFWQLGTLRPWGVGLHGSVSGLTLVGLAVEARAQNEVSVINLSPAVTTGTTPLGSSAPMIDPTTFDENFGALFSELAIVRERPRVNIINSSDTAGAGATLSRMVTNLGGDVISVDSGNKVKQSTITDHLGGSPLTGRLAPLIKASVNTDRNPGRADIEIVIGKDSGSIF